MVLHFWQCVAPRIRSEKEAVVSLLEVCVRQPRRSESDSPGEASSESLGLCRGHADTTKLDAGRKRTEPDATAAILERCSASLSR